MLDKTMLVQDLTADEMPAYAVTTQAPAVLTADVTVAVVLVEVARVVALTEVVDVELVTTATAVLVVSATGVLVLTTTGVVVATATEVLTAYVAHIRYQMFSKYWKEAYRYTGSCCPGCIEAAACTGQLLNVIVTSSSPSRQASSRGDSACSESGTEFSSSRPGCSINSRTWMISRIVAPQS